MIKLEYSKNFLKSVQKLPHPIIKKLADLLVIFQENPFHSTLHVKKLVGPLAGFYSFRITRDWRIIFQFLNSETIKLLRVGYRKDIYF